MRWESNNSFSHSLSMYLNEPCHEIMTLFVLRKLILQMRMDSHPVGLDVWFFGRTLRLLPFFLCVNSEGSGETARMRRLAWTFAGRLCDKYHNLMSWLKCNPMSVLLSFVGFGRLQDIWTEEEMFSLTCKGKSLPKWKTCEVIYGVQPEVHSAIYAMPRRRLICT